MKKTLTANIGGMVFHIEEDAFQVLKQYLDSVRNHFSGIEGGPEIQSDIESRIAELFSKMLGSSRQAIEIRDVQSVMNQVGTIDAIRGEAGEEDQFSQTDSANQSQSSGGDFQQQETTSQARRLSRDDDHKVFGGVCSGIAAYFELNPLWVRLGFLGITFGFLPFIPHLVGPMILLYLVLWIALPAAKGLDNPGKFRQFFRSRREKVLAGVCGGIGTYFNIDPTLIRVLFVLGFFLGGSGILLYIILWLITPEANSISDEIRMEGNQVNLNSIEEQIKKRISPDPKAPENTLTKVLLFPFRLISRVLTGIGPLLMFVVDAIRIFTALILLVIGGSFGFAIVVLVLSLLGLISASQYHIQMGDLPVDRISSELSPWLIGFGGFAALIPVIFIVLAGLSLAIKRFVVGPVVAISLVGLFLVSAFGTGFLLAPKIASFSKDGYVEKRMEFPAQYSQLSILANQTDDEPTETQYFPLGLKIKSYNGDKALLVQKFGAQGGKLSEARTNAKSASFSVVQVDSSLIFDTFLKVEKDAPYRAQRLEMTLFLPEGKQFVLDSQILDMLENDLPEGFDEMDISSKLWTVRGNKLRCINCPMPENETFPDSSRAVDEE